MTDYRKRLEDVTSYKALSKVYPEDWGVRLREDISALLSEGERMRELVADLERRAKALSNSHHDELDEVTLQRRIGEEAALRHAAELARQALGDPDQ